MPDPAASPTGGGDKPEEMKSTIIHSPQSAPGIDQRKGGDDAKAIQDAKAVVEAKAREEAPQAREQARKEEEQREAAERERQMEEERKLLERLQAEGGADEDEDDLAQAAGRC